MLRNSKVIAQTERQRHTHTHTHTHRHTQTHSMKTLPSRIRGH